MTTRVSTVADGVTTLFSIPFPYLDRDHVKVMLNGVTQSPSTYTWETTGTIRFIAPPGAGVRVTRYRETPSDALTIYQSGSVLTRDQLEVDSLQALYRTEEAEGVALRLPDDHIGDTLLPTLVPLAPLVVKADGTGFEMGSTELTGDMLLRGDLADGTDGLYTSEELGAVTRGFVDKIRGLAVDAADFGAIGDGSEDDDVRLDNAVNAAAARGITLQLDGTKTYAVGLQWAIPAGAKIRTNGATILDLNGTASNSPLITIGDNVEIDTLRVHVPTGKTRERVAVVTGDYFTCRKVHLTADDQQANTSDNDDAAFRMLGSDGAQIGRIIVDKFDRPVLIDDTEGTTIGGLKITNYVTGLWSVDNRNLTIGPSTIKTASPNASYTAGHVGVLLSGDGAGLSRNISLVDFNIEDSGEHGIRVGGPFSQENIHLVRSRIKNVGGSGIKILGTDSGAPTDFNNRIYITDPIIEDCASGGITTNMCGILVMYATDVVITNPIIRKQNKTVSASSAIRVVASADVEIVNPLCRDAQQHGIYLDGSLGALTRVNVQGGKCLANGVDGYRLAGFSNPLNDCNVDNLRSFSNGGLGFTIAGAGSTIGGRPSIGIAVGSNAGGAGACDRNSFTLRIEGGEGATPKAGVFARNGSTWNDHVTLHLMKAAAWTAL